MVVVSGSSAPVPASRETLGIRARALTPALQRTLPVGPVWQGAFPHGLPRGATLSVGGPAARSCTFSLLAAATRAGSWIALVGVHGPGWEAMGELDVALDRVITVETSDHTHDADGVAGALDGFDAVVIGVETRLSSSEQRRLAARARERGSVLIGLDEAWAGRRWVGPDTGRFPRGAYATGADVTVRTGPSTWYGVGQGSGRLRSRHTPVELTGRRLPGRHHTTLLALPDRDGSVHPVEPVAPVTPLVRP